MSKSTSKHLSEALSRDLTKAGAGELIKVSDDSVRQVFTANKDGAVWVFGHKQSDPEFWVGKKFYGSGPSSRVRMRRTPAASAE